MKRALFLSGSLAVLGAAGLAWAAIGGRVFSPPLIHLRDLPDAENCDKKARVTGRVTAHVSDQAYILHQDEAWTVVAVGNQVSTRGLPAAGEPVSAELFLFCKSGVPTTALETSRTAPR